MRQGGVQAATLLLRLGRELAAAPELGELLRVHAGQRTDGFRDLLALPFSLHIGALALLANVSVAAMLYAWREGDANMRSVWLCSRNDAIGNVAVMAAALGVFGAGSGWPDLAVASVMGVLALTAARSVIQQARAELRPVPAHA